MYEYIAVYVDDLALSLQDLQAFIDTLTTKFMFNLKGTSTLECYLACDFFRGENGILCMTQRKNI
jgi:hypothetical protein